MTKEEKIKEAANKYAKENGYGEFGMCYIAFKQGATSSAAMEYWQIKQFPKLIIEFNPEADETQYPYTAHLENCGGMVIQATSKEGCIQQMLTSIEVKMRYDVTIQK